MTPTVHRLTAALLLPVTIPVAAGWWVYLYLSDAVNNQQRFEELIQDA